MNTQNKQHYYNQLEELINSALMEMVDILDSADIHDIQEYVDFGEYGVAYDLFADILRTMNVEFPFALLTACKLMEAGSE